MTTTEERAAAKAWKKKIGATWFHDIGANVADPVSAYRKWEAWISALSENPTRPGPQIPVERRVRLYLLQAATSLSPASIKNYWRGGEKKQLNPERLQDLRRIDAALGFSPRALAPDCPQRRRRTGVRTLGVMTEFKDLPSIRYHQSVIRSLLEEGSKRNVSLAIHEVSRQSVNDSVMHLVRVHKYDGLVFIRLNPDANLCAFLRQEQIPLVTVHGDIRTYPSPPVLSNIYPMQKGLAIMLRKHVAAILRTEEAASIVIVHMPREGTPGSIRDERISGIERALRSPQLNAKVVSHVVADYSFRRAIEVYNRHPDADLFVCLADELAVALKHLLQASATDSGDAWVRRVIGFDAHLASLEGLVSFDQHLEQIGPEVMQVFAAFFERDPKRPSDWPEFQPKAISVSLCIGQT